jgi:hypothetical protein
VVDNNLDCFAETRGASVLYQNPDNGVIATVAPTRRICTRSPTRSSRRSGTRTCPRHPDRHRAFAVVETSSGIIWCQVDCDCSGQIGTPDAPVF